MRIALVGPSHPHKGGIAAHTTQTAHELAAAGHDVALVSWSRLYPGLLYPGEQSVPDGAPDLPPFEPTSRPLRWDRPASWWATGAALRRADLVIVVVAAPVQVPALLTLIGSLRRPQISARPRLSAPPWTSDRNRDGGHAGPGGRVPVVAIVHNVLPHEAHPGAPWLVGRLLRAVDGVLVHSEQQALLARQRGARRVETAPLAPHLPGPDVSVGSGADVHSTSGSTSGSGSGLGSGSGSNSESGSGGATPEPARSARTAGEPVRVLALGLVRQYKGFDLLLAAARAVPEIRLTVAGEQWGAAGQRVRELAADPALAGRVQVLAGYVPGEQLPAMLAAHDVLALPYRSATASQNVTLAHAHGLVVLASRVGTFPDEVRDGVDGLLVPPDDVAALAGALARLTAPGELERLRAAIADPDPAASWRRYLAALLAAGGVPGAGADGGSGQR